MCIYTYIFEVTKRKREEPSELKYWTRSRYQDRVNDVTIFLVVEWLISWRILCPTRIIDKLVLLYALSSGDIFLMCSCNQWM